MSGRTYSFSTALDARAGPASGDLLSLEKETSPEGGAGSSIRAVSCALACRGSCTQVTGRVAISRSRFERTNRRARCYPAARAPTATETSSIANVGAHVSTADVMAADAGPAAPTRVRPSNHAPSSRLCAHRGYRIHRPGLTWDERAAAPPTWARPSNHAPPRRRSGSSLTIALRAVVGTRARLGAADGMVV